MRVVEMTLVATVAAALGLGATAAAQYPPYGPSGSGSSGSGSSGSASSGAAQSQFAPIEVTANGNGIYDTQDLAFRPASVDARVGQVVRWRNTDTVVPHTATEDHGLWNLSGSYGQTPANPSGFAPGATVQRAFEAGTAHYYCMVHPKQMHGVVAVPVDLSISSANAAASASPSGAARRPADRGGRPLHRGARPLHRGRRPAHRRRHHRRRPPPTAAPKAPMRLVAATWASAAPAAGEVFDVQRREGDGPWQDYMTATREISATFSVPAGSVWHVRARLRASDDPARATDWSPDAAIQG